MEKQKCPEIRFSKFNENWSINSLGDLMNVGSVKRVHQADWCDAGVRFLRARDIVAFAKNEDIADPIYISQDRYEQYSNLSGKVMIGDLLVTGVGTIGVPMLVKNDNPLYFKDGNVIWFKNENTIDGLFLYYSFTTKTIQNFINDSAGIGTVGTYTITSGKQTPIYLPKKNEQIQIGLFFQDLDKSIALHEKKLAQTQNFKKAMLEKMFPKQGNKRPEIRLKGFSGDWKDKNIGDILKIKSGMSQKGIEMVKGKYPILATGGEIGRTDTPLFTKESVLIGRKGTIDKPYYMKSPFWTVDTLFYSEIYSSNFAYFIYVLFQKINWRNYNTSTGVPSLTSSTIHSIEIQMPKYDEQVKIANFFKQLEDVLKRQKQLLQTLKNLKQALLEKMFV